MDIDISDIIKTRDIIRKKFNAFRHGEAESSMKLEKQFKPVTEPLKAILKAQVKEAQVPETVVDEPKPDEPETEVQVDEAPRDKLYDLLETNFGPQVSGYLYEKLTSSAKIYDDTYGVKRDTDTNGWVIGNHPVSFDAQGNLTIDDVKYAPEPGFLELIFKKDPRGYTMQDLDQYHEVLEQTTAHRRSYNKDQPVNSNKSRKYKEVIAKLYPPESKQKKQKKKGATGSGIVVPSDQIFVPQNPKERVFVYWDDPNELVERLSLLMASKNAGHTGHDREILSIAEELREAGYIE